MNATTLTEWFARHHPHVEVDPERWAGTLPQHEPHELAAALDQWSEDWPQGVAPKPAEVGALIRQARGQVSAAEERARADAALAELRRKYPRRTREDRARARMVDDLRGRRPAPPIAPRRTA